MLTQYPAFTYIHSSFYTFAMACAVLIRSQTSLNQIVQLVWISLGFDLVTYMHMHHLKTTFTSLIILLFPAFCLIQWVEKYFIIMFVDLIAISTIRCHGYVAFPTILCGYYLRWQLIKGGIYCTDVDWMLTIIVYSRSFCQSKNHYNFLNTHPISKFQKLAGL